MISASKISIYGFLLIMLIVCTSCKHSTNLPVGQAEANINGAKFEMSGAQSGITVLGGGLYSTLTIIFGSAAGDGITITLDAPSKFSESVYNVKPVDHPDIENAQITFFSKDKHLYEALGKIGSGAVKIVSLTNNRIEGTFSGRLRLQGHLEKTIEVRDGKFNAKFTNSDE